MFAVNAAKASDAGQSRCASRDSVVALLNDRYGEFRQSTGLTPNGQVLEIFARPETGTWTILLLRPDGISCMIASGREFQIVNKTAGEADEKA